MRFGIEKRAAGDSWWTFIKRVYGTDCKVCARAEESFPEQPPSPPTKSVRDDQVPANVQLAEIRFDPRFVPQSLRAPFNIQLMTNTAL